MLSLGSPQVPLESCRQGAKDLWLRLQSLRRSDYSCTGRVNVGESEGYRNWGCVETGVLGVTSSGLVASNNSLFRNDRTTRPETG